MTITEQRVLSSSSGGTSSGGGKETPLVRNDSSSVYSLHTLHPADGSTPDFHPAYAHRPGKSGDNPPPPRGGGGGGGSRPKYPQKYHESEGSSTSFTTTTTGTSRDGSGGRRSGGGEVGDSSHQNNSEFRRLERAGREALESIASKSPEMNRNLEDYILTLREYRRECAARAMYKEAHLVHQVLRSLRFEEEAQHIRGLTEHQIGERRRMEEIHRDEFRAFHARWNKRIERFEEEQLEEEIRIVEQQNDELEAFHREMKLFQPHLGRYSKSLVDYRLKEHTLAKQQNYAKAYEVKEEGDAIEMRDLKKYENTKETMYGRRDLALRRRHQRALISLRNRVESRRNFLEQARKKELDELLQHYINARRELESHQNIVRSITGTILLKHACNNKTDSSGSHAIITSAASGAYGPMIKKQTRAYASERKKYSEQEKETNKGSGEQKRIKDKRENYEALSSSDNSEDEEFEREHRR